jgi:hypothetical protein
MMAYLIELNRTPTCARDNTLPHLAGLFGGVPN